MDALQMIHASLQDLHVKTDDSKDKQDRLHAEMVGFRAELGKRSEPRPWIRHARNTPSCMKELSSELRNSKNRSRHFRRAKPPEAAPLLLPVPRLTGLMCRPPEVRGTRGTLKRTFKSSLGDGLMPGKGMPRVRYVKSSGGVALKNALRV